MCEKQNDLIKVWDTFHVHELLNTERNMHYGNQHQNSSASAYIIIVSEENYQMVNAALQ